MARIWACIAVLALAGMALIAVACSSATATDRTGMTPARSASATAGSTSTLPAASAAASSTQAVKATNSLALAMLSRLGPGTNTVFSPFSVETALAMVDQGASGVTASQLDALLGDAPSPAALAASNRRLAGALHTAVTGHGSGGPTLNSANAVWLQTGLRLDTPFSTTLSEDFAAPAQQADFAADPSGAVQTINNWVSQKTGGLITNLMSPSEVTAQTNLVLANAVYLNARWQSQFDPNKTENGPFHTTGSSTVTVPFMDSGSLSRFPYADAAGYQAVALPYAHSSLQYVAVLPPAGRIGALERWLTVGHLASLTKALRATPLELMMPKFKLSFSTSLNSFLEGAGASSAFGPSSQLNRIVAGRSLAIGAVQHAATLQVAEKGTVAAAATGVSLAPTAVAEPPSLQVDLDHPFVVLIRDSNTGAILFAARVMNPSGA